MQVRVHHSPVQLDVLDGSVPPADLLSGHQGHHLGRFRVQVQGLASVSGAHAISTWAPRTSSRLVQGPGFTLFLCGALGTRALGVLGGLSLRCMSVLFYLDTKDILSVGAGHKVVNQFLGLRIL